MTNNWINLNPEEFSVFKQGLDQFDRQEFFQCHETWEKIWLNLTGIEKQLVQGLIQLAVGYHHLLNKNKEGALKLLNKALAKITKYPNANEKLDPLVKIIQNNIIELSKINCQLEKLTIPRVSQFFKP